MADDLRLPVEFTGAVSQPILEQNFAEAHVLAMMSEHEGFCVPAVEAMAAGLPVVGRAFAALPDTLAGAGLLVGPDDDALVLAEALHTVTSDVGRAEAMAQRGRIRAAELAPAVTSQAFLVALDRLI